MTDKQVPVEFIEHLANKALSGLRPGWQDHSLAKRRNPSLQRRHFRVSCFCGSTSDIQCCMLTQPCLRIPNSSRSHFNICSMFCSRIFQTKYFIHKLHLVYSVIMGTLPTTLPSTFQLSSDDSSSSRPLPLLCPLACDFLSFSNHT